VRIHAGPLAVFTALTLVSLRADEPPDPFPSRVLQTLQTDSAEAAHWTWIESFVLEKRAPDGEVRSRTTEIFEVFNREGRRMRRPISVDLANDSQGFAIARHEEDRFLDGEQHGEAGTRELKESPFEPDRLLRCFHFQPLGRDETAGSVRIKLAFTPIDGCVDDGSRAGRLLQQLTGTIWIDEERSDVVRIEGRIRKSVSFGFGILGKVESFEIKVERELVSPNLYLMSHVAYRARGTSFFFHQFDVESVRDRSGFERESGSRAKAPPTGSAP